MGCTECLMMRFSYEYSEAFLIRHKASTGIGRESLVTDTPLCQGVETPGVGKVGERLGEPILQRENGRISA